MQHSRLRSHILNRLLRSVLLAAVSLLTATFSVTAFAASNIYIASSQAAATTAGMTGTDSTANGSGPTTFQASGAAGDSLLLVSTLQAALVSGNVTVTTANASGTGVAKIIVVSDVTWASSNSLTLVANNCVEANGLISATGAANINFNVGPSNASVSCGGLTSDGVYVFNGVNSAGGNLSFSTGGGIAGDGQTIAFGSISTVKTTGSGNITVTTDPAATAGNWRSSGIVEVADGRIVVDVGGQQDIGGYTLSEVRATGTNATAVASGGQIDLRTRSGNISLTTVTGGTHISTSAGAMRINAANALLMTGGSSESADSSISPLGDLIITAKALYAMADSGASAGVRYGVNGASAAITLSGNPVAALSQPTNYTLYLFGAYLTRNFNFVESGATSVVITLTSGDAVLDGSNGANGFASSLNLFGSLVNTFTLQNGNLLMRAGDGDNASATISSGEGQLDVTVNGSALLQGSPTGTSAAFIGTDPGLTLKVLGPNGNLTLTAGDGSTEIAARSVAGINTQNGSVQDITVEGTLLMQGGKDPGFDAYINGPTQIVRAGNLIVRNGVAGMAYIRNAGGNQAYPQTITVAGNATLGTASGESGLTYIDHGGASPQTLVVGKSLTINPSALISSRDFVPIVTTIVVDNENSARPNRNTTNTFVNNGTLRIRPESQIHSVNPASTTLGSYVPGATLFNHWYGESGAVNGINYKSFADGTFTPPVLTVSKSGTGAGTVTSTPAGINCGATCSASFAANAVVTLTASASAGSTFSGWTGACTGVSMCVVTMDTAKNVNAAFTLQSFTLTVAKAGSGTGTVTTDVGGINCGSTCSNAFGYGTTVAFTATPSANATFTGWTVSAAAAASLAAAQDTAKAVVSGCGTGATCIVNVDAAYAVTATFAPLAVVAAALPVPTLGNWALVLLGLTLLGLTGFAIRPRAAATRK